MSQKGQLLREIDDLAKEIAEISMVLYENPELPKEEYQSVEFLTGYLKRHGFQVECGVAGLKTAFVARYSGRPGGPRIGFLAEYDALPEVGHGCGHNLIAASCVGAAVALSKLAHVPGEILVYGTPDEEYDGGKILMAEAGVFAGLDVALQVHVSPSQNCVGGSSTPHQTMVVGFRGQAAHTAANPSEGINALNAVLITFVGLHAMQQNLKPGTRLPATITHGGGAPNAVPKFAQFRVHVTALEPDYLLEVVEKIRNCARAGALATGAEADIWSGPIYKKLEPNEPLAGALAANMVALGLELEDPPPAKAATDVGNVSWECPTVMGRISLDVPDVPMHSAELADATVSASGMKATLDATRAMACTALDVMEDPDLLRRIRSAFSHWRAGL